MRRVAIGLIVLAGALAALPGCPNPTMLHGARTIGPGGHEAAVGVAAYGADLNFLSTEQGSDAELVGMTVDAMYRYGVTDYFDVGFAVTGLGLVSYDMKFELFDTEFVTMAVDPGIGGIFWALGETGANYLQIQGPLMLDIHTGDVLSILMSAKYSGLYSLADSTSGGADSFTHWMGGTLGLRFRVASNEGGNYNLMPYGGFMVPIGGFGGANPDVMIWSGGLAFVFES